MGLFNKEDKKQKVITTRPTAVYDMSELEKKEKEGKPLTREEYDALSRAKTQEVLNKVLRVFGVVTLVFVVVLAIGCFLYPYSLFNLFGSGDKFWDCWQHIQYHVSASDMELIYGEGYGGREITDGMGWADAGDLITRLGYPGASAKLNFLGLGSWSIILVSTIGIVAAVIFTAYLVAYNIKDLIGVIKHVTGRTGAVVSDIALSAVESVAQTNEQLTPNSKKKTPKKKEKAKQLFESETEEEKENGISSEVNQVEPLKESHRTEDDGLSGLSSEDYDKLLSGESLDKKEDKPDPKSLF